jgi:D-3-phosphoglycerate dehydrogenase
MLACCRDIARMHREVRSGTWSTREGVQLFGKTLGVIGLGGIGREVLRIGRGLGMRVIAWNRTPRPGEALVALDELLIRSDVISRCTSRSTTTPADFSGRRRWRA